ncbi:MAG: sugar O-acyltransferase, sialic acid O-acetyltransferase NeuD family [Marmoricola sp.]|nr:sugar O-acyltransferase, sialic acid O-acetyltransferase NeuD family [Marmoricola sp.]
MSDLVIVGTGLFAEVVRDYFEEFTDSKVLAFACHEKYRTSNEFAGRPVVCVESLEQSYPPDSVKLFVAIGYRQVNKLRQAAYEELKARGYRFATFVAPDIKTWRSNEIGENVFIFENNVIQPHVRIGNNTILWSGNHIGHHSTVGRNCFISSHVVVSGSCTVGDNTFIGVNSTLHDGITIGADNVIAAGSIIARSTKDREVYVPNATKVFPKTSDRLEF